MRHQRSQVWAASHWLPRLRDASLWWSSSILAGVTLLHYMTDAHLIPYHSIYRSLYYVPIAVAAVRYGWRGGMLAALLTSALYVPHVLLAWHSMPGDGFNNLLENVVFLFVGVLTGTLADAERTQRQRAQLAARQLADANTQLQVQAEEAERMRASLASILDSIDSGVVTLDQAGDIGLVNRAAQGWLAHAPVLDLIRRYHAGGGRGYHQHAVAERALGLHGAPLLGAHSQAIGTVVVLDDLTEQRALEVQIWRAERLAALGRLAGGLAHEIRNPLGIVRAAAQLLHRRLGADAALAEYTEVMRQEIDRVDRLIEQLLAYARPRAASRHHLDLGAVAARAIEITRIYAAQRQVDLTLTAPPGLPSVHGDSDLLHQALVNLLLNGIQAMPAGGSVAVDVSADAAAVVLHICDTGSGIAAADLAHIFDPFFTTREEGTGLGLSIVQQIVQEHDGNIAVTSTPGAGTCFIVRLPHTSTAG